MSKRKKHTRSQTHVSRVDVNTSSTATRDWFSIARAAQARAARWLSKPLIGTVTHVEKNYSDLRNIEDRRTLPRSFRSRPHLRIDGTHSRIKYTPVYPRMRRMPVQMFPAFSDSGRVITCIRRSSRRRTLFALQKIGKGRGGSQKSARWTAQSFIRCK